MQRPSASIFILIGSFSEFPGEAKLCQDPVPVPGAVRRGGASSPGGRPEGAGRRLPGHAAQPGGDAVLEPVHGDQGRQVRVGLARAGSGRGGGGGGGR